MIQKVVAGALFAFLGYTFPRMWLKTKVKSKQKAVLRSLAGHTRPHHDLRGAGAGPGRGVVARG